MTKPKLNYPGFTRELPLRPRLTRQLAPLTARKHGLLALLGPGLITGASDDDPSGIATYSQAGAQFGYSMTWVMLFSFPLMAAIQEVCARIGRVPARGSQATSASITPHGFACHRTPAARRQHHQSRCGSRAMGEALRHLIGGPAHLYVFVFAVGCVLLEIFSRYARYVEILKWTTLSLLSYVATALVVDVPWREVAYHTFIPSFIWQKDYIVTSCVAPNSKRGISSRRNAYSYPPDARSRTCFKLRKAQT